MENAPKPETSLREKYQSKTDGEGFVRIADFATIELGRQAKSIAEFLDKNEDYFLGEGLKYKGDLGNYDMKIHIDDLDEFVKRVKDHYGN